MTTTSPHKGRPSFKPQRQSVKPGQIMLFMEVPDGTLYWHLREERAFTKLSNGVSKDGDKDAIHGLFDAVKVLDPKWHVATQKQEKRNGVR